MSLSTIVDNITVPIDMKNNYSQSSFSYVNNKNSNNGDGQSVIS